MLKWLTVRTPVSRAERLLVAVVVVATLVVEPACGRALVGALAGLPAGPTAPPDAPSS